MIPYHFTRYDTYNFDSDGNESRIIKTKFDSALQAECYYSGGMMGNLHGSLHYEEMTPYTVRDVEQRILELIEQGERSGFQVQYNYS
jgi:hypothetical protein